MMAISVLVVLIVSILVYWQTNNYGEAALALVAGLLTAFTVTWTPGIFAAFIVAWVSLSLFALLFSSVKLAAESERIYTDAAQSISTQQVGKTRKQLEEIGKDEFIKMLGPIRRAETIRLFAFRKLPMSSMRYGLRAVETLSTITRVDHETAAEFVIDVYKMFESTPGPRYQQLLNRILGIMGESPVSPREFIEAFRDSRLLALSGNIDPEKYFQYLTEALEIGVVPAETYEYLQEVLE